MSARPHASDLVALAAASAPKGVLRTSLFSYDTSPLERRLGGWRRRGVPLGLPEPVHDLGFDPRRRWRLDLAWPEVRLAAEVASGTWLRGRRVRGGVLPWLRDVQGRRVGRLAGAAGHRGHDRRWPGARDDHASARGHRQGGDQGMTCRCILTSVTIRACGTGGEGVLPRPAGPTHPLGMP